MNHHEMNPQPRLAIVVSSDRRRGAEVFGEALAGGLRDRGWEVRLFSLTSSSGGPLVDATPLSTIAPDELGRLDRTVVASLRAKIGDYRPDVVLANGAATMQYVVAGLRLGRNRPRLVYVSIGEPMYWIRNRQHRLMRTAILKGVDRVLSVSATTAKQLVDHLGVPAAKVRVAPTGVPPRFFDAVPEAATDQLHVIFVGNLSEEKDPVAALDVVERARRDADVKLRFLGSGPLRDALEQEVSRREMRHHVEILGSVRDVVPHLEWADVLLLTSKTEGLPGVPLEAGAAAVPSVVYAAGGSAETVADGVTGRVVPVGDVVAAASVLVDLAADPALLRRWGDAARKRVADGFTLAQSVDRYIDLLAAEVAAARMRPPS